MRLSSLSFTINMTLHWEISFEGRILRALRIAARLGLSLSKEIEAAIHTFSLLVKGLDKVL